MQGDLARWGKDHRSLRDKGCPDLVALVPYRIRPSADREPGGKPNICPCTISTLLLRMPSCSVFEALGAGRDTLTTLPPPPKAQDLS